MSTKKAKPEEPDLKAIAKEWSELKELSGSGSGYFTLALVNQVWRSLYRGEGTAEWILQLGERAAQDALAGIAPRDPLEGMLAAQMVATHETAMDCFRRAQLAGQTFEGRRQNLEFANKLARSYATLVETLDKHRGKGQQVVRVEHVTVNAGGQAIVGAMRQGGEWREKRGTSPCTAAHPCSRARAARRGPAAGARVGRRPCTVSGAAGCMVAVLAQAASRATGTPSSTAATRPRQWHSGGMSVASSVPPVS